LFIKKKQTNVQQEPKPCGRFSNCCLHDFDPCNYQRYFNGRINSALAS